MSFVKLSIFGTSFEVRLRSQTGHVPGVRFFRARRLTRPPGHHSLCRPPTSRNGCVPHLDCSRCPCSNSSFQVPSALYGTFAVSRAKTSSDATPIVQLGQGSAYRIVRRDQEDHEALQHPRPQQTHLQRAQAPQAYTARERTSLAGPRLGLT